MNDITNTNIPIMIAISGAVWLGSFLIGAFTIFETKKDADKKVVLSDQKIKSVEVRVEDHQELLQQISNDVSFIRGRLEKKD